LAPGASTSCTGDRLLTQADIDAGSGTNTAKACGDPPTGTEVCDTDGTTTTITRSPAIDLVKSSTTTLITAVGQVVPYSYAVKNTGNVTLTGVTVTDNQVSSVTCAQTTLAPGASTTCTGTHTVTQAELDAGGNLTNLATAKGTPPPGVTPSPVSDTDTKSIPIQPPLKGHIMHTQVTCADFVSNNPSNELDRGDYSVKSGKVNNVSPGVMFYYISITAPSANFTVNVTQSNASGWKPIPVQDVRQVVLYEANCTSSSKGTPSVATDGTATLTVKNATQGATYIVGVKYSLSSLTGQSVSAPFPTVEYKFATNFNGNVGSPIASSQDSIKLFPKP